MPTRPLSTTLRVGDIPRIELVSGQADLLSDYVATVLGAIAGTGGGKTALGGWWLIDRMDYFRGYAWGVAEPTYQMLEKIILRSPDPERPSLMELLRSVGYKPDYEAFARIIHTNRGDIYIGSADNPNTMQGPALHGYWLDEAGMMSLDAYYTALQRVSGSPPHTWGIRVTLT